MGVVRGAESRGLCNRHGDESRGVAAGGAHAGCHCWKPVGIDWRRLRNKRAMRRLLGDPVLPIRIQDGLKISPVTASALNLARWVVQLQLTAITLQSETLWISKNSKNLNV